MQVWAQITKLGAYANGKGLLLNVLESLAVRKEGMTLAQIMKSLQKGDLRKDASTLGERGQYSKADIGARTLPQHM